MSTKHRLDIRRVSGMSIRGISPALVLVVLLAAGCQQKMAEQPAPRPYEQHPMFPNNQSIRPLEKGVVHRNQRTDDDHLTAWLTPEGRKGNPDAKFTGDAAYDPKNTVPPIGAPTKKENFVAELPFAITESDLLRGQTLYNANCALCHGGSGYGNGKIVERGVLRPPSYHTVYSKEGVVEKDWSTLGSSGKPQFSMSRDEKTGEPTGGGLLSGHSRGFYRYGLLVPLKDVPVGYIYQVITWGYGGMASHATQLPNPIDRWRVVSYVRTLQFSQDVKADDLPANLKNELAKPTSEVKK